MQSDPGDALPKLRKANSISSKPPKKSRKMTLDIAEVSVEDGDQAVETTSNQLVLYNPGTHDTGQDAVADTGRMVNHASSFQNFLRQTSSGRVLPSIGAFTVQCAECFKWRLIPTKEKYEEIREHILQQPFVCERAREWRPDISCEDPADISQDGSRLWAIDKPNIAQPPPGWERLLRIRGEGSTKFADVYYAAPSGKKLRSMVEVDRYLLEHPEYISQGVSRSQFSFQIPRPLQENYVRKRSARTANSSDVPALERPLEPEEVNPLSWAAPTSSEVEIAGNPIEVPPSKKRTARNPSKHLYNSPVYDQGKIKIEDGQQSRNAPTFEL